MEISEATPLPKWALWTWFVYPALAIAIGGGLGYFVAVIRESHHHRVHATVEAAVVAAPPPSAPQVEVAPVVSPEIEIEPDPIKPGIAPKPKARPQKPIKGPRCNVYDHMNGC